MTAIVIPVRPGERNDELRFALRSIALHVSDPDVWIVGHRPAWLRGVHYLPTRPTGAKSDRGCQQTRAAVAWPELPEEFWWWDDDMYRMEPLTGPEFNHGGCLRTWLDRYHNMSSRYAEVLRRTAEVLPSHALMYDLHAPFWVPSKRALAFTLGGLPDGRGGWLWRTVYGNAHRLGGTEMRDVKVYRSDPIWPGPWLSSDDRAWSRVKPWLAARFASRSPWESPSPSTRVTYTRNGAIKQTFYRPTRDAQLTRAGWQRVAPDEPENGQEPAANGRTEPVRPEHLGPDLEPANAARGDAP